MIRRNRMNFFSSCFGSLQRMRTVIAVVCVCVLYWATEGALSRQEIQRALEANGEVQLENLLERLVERIGEETEQEDEEFVAEKAITGDVIGKAIESVEDSVSRPCCALGTTTVDLRKGGVYVTDGGVGQVIVKPEGTSSPETCSLRALLKVTFDKLPSCITGCLTYPLCGRRMLRVDLDLSPTTRSGFMFNIGDSVSNDGYGGDANHQTNDAEIEAIHPSVHVRRSDNCPTLPSLLASYTDAVKLGAVNQVTLFISNEHVRITNDNGLNQILCHKCLFALNGQADPSNGGVNEDIYIALNRVISGRADRNGVGVCSAKLKWVCPEQY